MSDIYGFVLEHENPDRHLRFIPKGCTRMLVYSQDAKSFWEESAENYLKHGDDFANDGIMENYRPLLDKVYSSGKYKLDIAIRLMFARYANSKMKEMK